MERMSKLTVDIVMEEWVRSLENEISDFRKEVNKLNNDDLKRLEKILSKLGERPCTTPKQ